MGRPALRLGRRGGTDSLAGPAALADRRGRFALRRPVRLRRQSAPDLAGGAAARRVSPRLGLRGPADASEGSDRLRRRDPVEGPDPAPVLGPFRLPRRRARTRRARSVSPRARAGGLARGLDAVFGAQGALRGPRLARLGRGPARARCGRPRAGLGRARGRDLLPGVPPVPVLPAVGPGPDVGARAGHHGHGRHADLRLPRQRRRVGASRPLPARRVSPARGGLGSPARLLLGDRPALGQSALPLGALRGDGLRLVGGADPGEPAALRPPSHRSLPRVCGVLVGPGDGDDGDQRKLAAGPRSEALRRRARRARRRAASDRRGGPRTSSPTRSATCSPSSACPG